MSGGRSVVYRLTIAEMSRLSDWGVMSSKSARVSIVSGTSVVCREVMKLKVHRRGAAEVVAISAAHAASGPRHPSEGAPDRFATVLATGDSQLPVYAMKSTMALPGLEPGRGVSRNGF